MIKVRIYVTYKPSVFDTQSEVILKSIKLLKFQDVTKISTGKFFDLTIEDEADVEKVVKGLTNELLVNSNLETFSYKILEETKWNLR